MLKLLLVLVSSKYIVEYKMVYNLFSLFAYIPFVKQSYAFNKVCKYPNNPFSMHR